MLIFCVQAAAKLQTASVLVLTTFFLSFLAARTHHYLHLAVRHSFSETSSLGPPLFGLHPNGLFTFGLFMIGLSPFGLPMMFGLSPFGLF